MRMFVAAAILALVGVTGSTAFAKDITGQVWVLSVDKPGSATTDSTKLKTGDTISYAVFAPVKDQSVDGNVVCTKGSKYDAFLLNQTKKGGKIATQTFMVWDSQNDGELWDMGKCKISVVSSVGPNGKKTPLVDIKTGLRGNLLLGQDQGGKWGVTVSLGKTFDSAKKNPTCVFRFPVKGPKK